MSTIYPNSGDNPIFAAINAAQDTCDPLERLVDKVGTDPDAAFSPEVLERLAVDDISPEKPLSETELPFAGWAETSPGSRLGDER